MNILGRPEAELVVDAPLVRALLTEQHQDLANLPLEKVAEGWDNALFRLGDEQVVRLPRRHLAAALIEHEQRWLPELAPHLTLAVPVPQRLGRPGRGFPWAWTVGPWFDGRTLATEPPMASDVIATQLGQFFAALHRPAPPEAPVNTYRRTLPDRHARFIEQLDQLDRLGAVVDASRIRAAWDGALDSTPWSGPPLWLHGDPHPGNLVARDGALVAVIDFGDLTAGDPAVDLAAAWMLLPSDARDVLRAAATSAWCVIDDETWRRARGWALTLAVSYLAHSRDNRALARIADSTIRAVLADVDRCGA